MVKGRVGRKFEHITLHNDAGAEDKPSNHSETLCRGKSSQRFISSRSDREDVKRMTLTNWCLQAVVMSSQSSTTRTSGSAPSRACCSASCMSARSGEQSLLRFLAIDRPASSCAHIDCSPVYSCCWAYLGVLALITVLETCTVRVSGRYSRITRPEKAAHRTVLHGSQGPGWRVPADLHAAALFRTEGAFVTHDLLLNPTLA